MTTRAQAQEFRQIHRESHHALEDSYRQLQRRYEQAHEDYLTTLAGLQQEAWEAYGQACRDYHDALKGGRETAPAQQRATQTYQRYLEHLQAVQGHGESDREAARAYGKYLHALNEASVASPEDGGAPEQCYSEYLETLAALGRGRLERQRALEAALVEHLIASQEASEEVSRQAEQAYRRFTEQVGQITSSLDAEARWQEAGKRYMEALGAAWQDSQRQQLEVAEATLQASRALLERNREEQAAEQAEARESSTTGS